MKITPAHDPDDYAMSRRHGLEAITVLDEEARINAAGGEFFGRDRYEAREAILDRLREMGDLVDTKPHDMVVGHCDRCGTVVEPRLSVQWFIKVQPLAERALASVREGRTKILPAHFEKVYAHWMENIHDWAVGRQLWWGHRIPAWFCPDGHVTVTDDESGPDACAECARPAADLTQETDIFDTWFSSGLWPFSTLGWPDETPDMARFYPTSVMETGYDILFFWVARMMMLGLFLTDREPFHTVYLHGMIRAEGGLKMSKTKGNTIDPLSMVDEIGADALRFALMNGSAPGSDMRLTQAKLDGGRNFTNKLWNAARFVLGARPAEVAGGRRCGIAQHRGGVDHLPVGRCGRARNAPARRARSGWICRDRVRRRVGRLLRLVPGDGEGRSASRRRIAGRSGGHLGCGGGRTRHPASPAPSAHAVRDREDLGGAARGGTGRCPVTAARNRRVADGGHPITASGIDLR